MWLRLKYGVIWTVNPRLWSRLTSRRACFAFVAVVEVVCAEVLVEGAVFEHVVGGGEHGSGNGADGFLGSAPGAECAGTEPGDSFLLREAAQAHWISVVFSQGAPFFMRLDRRLPALSSFFGDRVRPN
jgi:hypothetical protein